MYINIHYSFICQIIYVNDYVLITLNYSSKYSNVYNSDCNFVF